MRLIRAVGILLLLASGAWAQEINLKVRPATVGDRVRIRIESTIDLDMTTKDAEGERTSQLTQIVTEVFRQEVVAVESEGVWSARVWCETAELQRSGTNSPLQKVEMDHQGKEFVVRRAIGGRATVEMADRSALLPLAANVGGWEDLALLLPSQPVKIGDQWVVQKDAAALWAVANLVETDAAQQVVATLKSVEEGRATLSFSGEVSGRARDGSRVKASLKESTMVLEVETGRVLKVQMAGELEFQKEISQVSTNPTTMTKESFRVGEVRAKSRKLEVNITFE